MYCVYCGVELGENEEKCPLCYTPVYRPERPLPAQSNPRLYPHYEAPAKSARRRWTMTGVTAVWLIIMIWLFLIDLKINQKLLWSGYALGGMGTAYLGFLLPFWFEKPNLIVFTALGGFVAIWYVGLICLLSGGNWFWGFALPIGMILLVGILVVLILIRYLHKGYLFIAGGAMIGLGLYAYILEVLLCAAFSMIPFVFWSFYALGGCSLIGLILIFLGACRPAREALRRRFFL